VAQTIVRQRSSSASWRAWLEERLRASSAAIITTTTSTAITTEKAMSNTSTEIEDAVQKERARCLNIALEQYRYWRGVTDEMILDFSTGAMGASANILAAILDPQMKPMQRAG